MTEWIEAQRPRDTRTLARADAVPLGATALFGLAGVAAAWTAAISALAIWRHHQFLSHRFDLGNMVQAVWSTTHGRPLETTDGLDGEQITRLAAHVDPILVFLAPLWSIHPAPETLIISQAAALAAGLYPVVRLARKYVGSALAAGLLGAWYLLFPWIVWNAFNDFHPVTLSIPLLLYAIWFLDEHRIGRFAVVAFLALLTGELVGLTVAAIGVWYAIRHHRARAGIAIAASATAWTVLCLKVVIPLFNDGNESRFYDRFESVGGSPWGVVRTVFVDPEAIIEAVSSRADLAYATLLLVPTAFFALGEPLLLAAVAPQLTVNTLSDFWSTTQPTYQYVSPMVAPLVAASIMGMGRLREGLRSLAAAGALAMAVACVAAWPPIPGGEHYVYGHRETPERVAAMREAISQVPRDVPLTATNRLGAHLSARRIVHLFPNRERAEWVVLDVRDPWLATAGERYDTPRFEKALRRFGAEPGWKPSSRRRTFAYIGVPPEVAFRPFPKLVSRCVGRATPVVCEAVENAASGRQ